VKRDTERQQSKREKMSTDQRDDENATIVTSDAKTTTIFHFEGAAVRFVGTAERPEWVARDVCEILGTDRSQIRRLEEYPVYTPFKAPSK